MVGTRIGRCPGEGGLRRTFSEQVPGLVAEPAVDHDSGDRRSIGQLRAERQLSRPDAA